MTTGGDRSGSGRRSGVSEMWRDLHVLLHVPRNVQDSLVQGLTCVVATCEGEPQGGSGQVTAPIRLAHAARRSGEYRHA